MTKSYLECVDVCFPLFHFALLECSNTICLLWKFFSI